MLCLPTPSFPNGEVKLNIIENVFERICEILHTFDEPPILVIRSTVPPDQIRPLFDKYFGHKQKVKFALNPEFMRESTAIHDFFHPPFCIVGCDEASIGEHVLALYNSLDCSKHIVNLETAALVKYGSNAFHALKIVFANEMGNIASVLGIDPVFMMKILASDKVLNASSAYLKPGFAFGGSCLPKDLRGLIALAKRKGISTSLFETISHCNASRIHLALTEILRIGSKKIAVLGMSFKKGTDDLRESPYIELIEQLIGKGCDVRIFDPDINLEYLKGSNLQYFNQHHYLFSRFAKDIETALEDREIVILCKNFLSHQQMEDLRTSYYKIIDLEYIHSSEITMKQRGIFEFTSRVCPHTLMKNQESFYAVG